MNLAIRQEIGSLVKSILITRPLPDAYSTQHYLQHFGFSCFIEPLLSLRYLSLNLNSLLSPSSKPIQALILTSRNGVRALYHLMPYCQLPIVTIGEKTAQLAKELGFQVAHCAYGDSSQLASLIGHHYSPEHGRLIYFSGDKTAKDNYLARTLTDLHYRLEHIPIYHMESQSSFTTSLISAFENQHIGAITFFSPRTAELFIQLANDSKLIPFLHFIPAFFLSTEVAKALKPHYFSKAYISPLPTNVSLCDLVGKYLKT